MTKANSAIGLILSVMTCAVPTQAMAAQTAYVSGSNAYLVETTAEGKAANVASNLGAGAGTYADSGSQRTITLTTPISYKLYEGWCAFQVEQVWRRDVTTLTLRQLDGDKKKGHTEVAEAGVDTQISGCNVGEVRPFGGIGEWSMTMKHTAFGARPNMDNVMPGTRWAGLHEGTFQPESNYFPGSLPADIVTWQNDGLVRFERTGLTVPATITADGWWSLALPGGDRRYTRLERDKSTGAEVWVYGEFVGGKAIRVASWWLVPYKPGRGFGSIDAASRSWEYALQPATYFRNLYNDLSEDVYLFDAEWFRWTGWTWQFSGLSILHRLDSASTLRLRTWEPVRRVGAAQWVMDEYRSTNKSDGREYIITPRQLMYYIDSGPAIKPTASKRGGRMKSFIDHEPVSASVGSRSGPGEQALGQAQIQ